MKKTNLFIKMLLKLYHFFLGLLIITLLLAVSVSIIPGIFGIKPFIVLSGSMEPQIHTGSMAYINTKADPYAIHSGDIITYELSDTVVTHRVIDETVATVTTKGDANEEADFSPVTRDCILGKYLFSIPYLGYLYSYITTPFLFPVLVSLFAVELIISTIYQFISKKEEKT